MGSSEREGGSGGRIRTYDQAVNSRPQSSVDHASVSHPSSHAVRSKLRQRPIYPMPLPLGWKPPRAFRRAALQLLRPGRKQRRARAKMLRLIRGGNGQAVRGG